MSTRFQLLAVDDHPIVVEGLAALLKREAPELEWAGVARTYPELLQRLEALVSEREHPNLVVLIDLNLGDGEDPVDRVRALTAAGIRVVVLTSEARPVPLRQVLEAGALGLALKSDEVTSIADVVRTVAAGEQALSSEIAFAFASDDKLIPQLSDRELQVLRLLADGLPRKSVGRRLDPPVKLATVATYLNRIFQKYQVIGRDVNTFQDAVREAVRDGYLPSPGSGAN
ncbi:MAG: response regulator transcription factor [bacterium]|nr:response regulator transcription factor [bacterium]